MIDDTPRPERVTLSAEERKALAFADRIALPGYVERIVAAREQALREEIAGQIEADCEADEPPCYGCWNAARIARGETR